MSKISKVINTVVVVGGFSTLVSKLPITKPIDVVDYNQYDKDYHTEDFYEDINRSGSAQQKDLVKDLNFLLRQIEIYLFLDDNGLGYHEGELNQYSFDYEKELNKKSVDDIKKLYYKNEEGMDKKIERILSYYLNSSKYFIDNHGIEIANKTLERDLEFKVASAVNEEYIKEGEEPIITIQNIDDLVSIDSGEEEFGSKVVSIKDPETDVTYPYVAGNNHNVVYNAVELNEKTNDQLKKIERAQTMGKIEKIRKILNQALILRSADVEVEPGNKIVTDKPKTAKKKILSLYN